MATFSVQNNMQWNDANFDEILNLSYEASPTGGDMYKDVQSIPTSDTLISFGSMTPAWMILKNLDDTNDVHYGPDNAGSILQSGILKPGENSGAIRLATTTWRAIAQVATCKILVVAFPS